MPRGRRAGPPPSSSISGTAPVQVRGCGGEVCECQFLEHTSTPWRFAGWHRHGTERPYGDKTRTFAQRLQLHPPALPISLGANGSPAPGGRRQAAGSGGAMVRSVSISEESKRDA